MTDRTTPHNAAVPAPGTPPDDLVQRYHAASAEDGSPRGPSPEANARVLAYAREQAALRAASSVPPALTPAPDAGTNFGGEPANDRRWLRHALGSLAAIGLVGWLTLHHLDEPGAPQLDSPAPASLGESAPTTSPSPATQPMANDTMASSAASASLEEKAPTTPTPSAPSAAKSEAKSMERVAPRAASTPSVAATAGGGGDGGVGAAASAGKVQQHAPERSPAMADRHAATASATPAPPSAAMPAPAAPVAMAPPPQLERRARVKEAESSSSASADASMNANTAATERMAEAAPPATAEHRAANGKAKPLPYCNPTMSAAAQAEQARRIKAREDAQAAGKPLPDPAPVCKPLQNPATPQTEPLDSR